jgi:hypothetical protein
MKFMANMDPLAKTSRTIQAFELSLTKLDRDSKLFERRGGGNCEAAFRLSL